MSAERQAQALIDHVDGKHHIDGQREYGCVIYDHYDSLRAALAARSAPEPPESLFAASDALKRSARPAPGPLDREQLARALQHTYEFEFPRSTLDDFRSDAAFTADAYESQP